MTLRFGHIPNRAFRVKFASSTSSLFPQYEGVPQGTLFLYYHQVSDPPYIFVLSTEARCEGNNFPGKFKAVLMGPIKQQNAVGPGQDVLPLDSTNWLGPVTFTLDNAFVKEFRDTENEHAHAVLRSLPAYSATTVACGDSFSHIFHQYHALPLSNLDWERCSAEEVANGFIAMSQQCLHRPMDLEDSQHSGLCTVLTDRLAHLKM
ncbi:uncharacterized protein LOC119575585 [Penaeus monodon]|uniref:uncharacterized protein LOC119575585 n=1 Tax=Penaeus monodon TaxID=6687 RepID=UPI0018A75CF8|nr:uncharacterized protein LOC119575585 [Penaeus monodon]